MPIGVSPRIQQSQVREYMPVDAYNVLKGFALALIDDNGTMKLVPCSALSYARAFVGFADATRVEGRIPLVTAQGSRVNPVVEGGAPLVPGQSVWISETAGRVTQTPPNSSGAQMVRVGVADTTSTMIIVRDQSPQVG